MWRQLLTSNWCRTLTSKNNFNQNVFSIKISFCHQWWFSRHIIDIILTSWLCWCSWYLQLHISRMSNSGLSKLCYYIDQPFTSIWGSSVHWVKLIQIPWRFVAFHTSTKDILISSCLFYISSYKKTSKGLQSMVVATDPAGIVRSTLNVDSSTRFTVMEYSVGGFSTAIRATTPTGCYDAIIHVHVWNKPLIPCADASPCKHVHT